MSQEEESKAKRKSKSLPPKQTEDRKWEISYPVYVVRTSRVPALEAQRVLAGGGGGQSKTGVPNAFVCASRPTFIIQDQNNINLDLGSFFDER